VRSALLLEAQAMRREMAEYLIGEKGMVSAVSSSEAIRRDDDFRELRARISNYE
jgi:hypothetical protein